MAFRHVPRDVEILSGATGNGAGASFGGPTSECTFQSRGSTASGAGTATIEFQGSNNGSSWVVIGTVTLTLAVAEANDGFVKRAPWRLVRANVTALTGVGASISASISY